MSINIANWPDPPLAEPTDADIEVVRFNTNNPTDLDDNQLRQIISAWWYADANDVSQYDLWAASAVVLEAREIGLLDKKDAGAQSVSTADTSITWGRSRGGNNLTFMRGLIRRYWRRAHPNNREIGRPSGWKTVDIHTAGRFRFPGWPWANLDDYLVVNGPTGWD